MLLAFGISVRIKTQYMNSTGYKNLLPDDSNPNERPNVPPAIELDQLKTRAEIEKLHLESKELRRRWPKSVSILVAVLTALISGLGVVFTDRQSEKKLRQAQEFHEDELFSKAVQQFQDSKPDQRGPAMVALAYHARTSPKNRDEAIALIAHQLQTESDPRVLELTIQALPALGTTELDFLVQKNRLLYEHLARATGRLLGIQSVLRRINMPGRPTLDEVMAGYLFKQLPLEVARTSLPWQDVSTSDTGFFQTPDQLEIHSGFRTAFEQAVKSHQATPKDETDAENEFQASIRDLWVNTQAIVSMLKSLSGNLGGVNLRKTVLLHPHLAGINLRGIDARFAVWMAPVLAGADLSFANLSEAEMKYADLRHAKLIGADIARVHFGQQNKSFEERTLAEIRFLQNDAVLDGTNLWELANCYLRGQQFDPAKLQEFKNRRQQVLETDEAKEYLAKIPNTVVDD